MKEPNIIEDMDSLDVLTPIRVETALSRFPVHRLSKSGIVEIDLHNQAGAVHWEVSHNSKFGQPGPLAYKLDTLVINRRIDEIGKPVPEIIKLGSLREIADELGCGGDTNKVKRALRQNSSAYVEARLTYKGGDGSEHWVEEGFSRYSIILTGEQLPSGRKADAVYIRLHPTYRHILNTALTRPLDYDYMKSLAPSAQRLYEIASYQVHHAVKTNAMYARVKYSTYCLLAPAPRYFTFDQVKKQMYKVHRSHIDSGYLKEVRFEATTDENGHADWIMLYKPGPNADRWYQEFLPGAARAHNARRARLENDGQTLPFPDFFSAASAMPAESIANPVASPLPPVVAIQAGTDSPEILALIEELKSNDLNGSDAVRFAREKPEVCRRQLGYLPHVGKFTSTKGAYLRRAIEEDYGAPKGYADSQAKAQTILQQQEQAADRKARKDALEARRAMEATEVDEILSQLKNSDPEAFDAFLSYVDQERQKQSARFSGLKANAIKTKLLSRFDTTEKRRELFALWQAERTPQQSNRGLTLPADPVNIERRHIGSIVIKQIVAELSSYDSQRTDEQPRFTITDLLDAWILQIRSEDQKIADPDKAFADFALEKLYADA